MTIQCTAHHGFRYCSEVANGAESAIHPVKWKKFLMTLMITIFLVILFILL